MYLQSFSLVFCLLAPFATAVTLDPHSFSLKSFDYLVIGGGTTGLAVAARLSDDPHSLVGVIEAGEHMADNTILVPGFAASGVGNPRYDWLLSSTPQQFVNNRTIGLGRGKLLGGTSAMNFLGYTRASKTEYDGWGELGNPGWSFDALLPDMKAAERWTPPTKQAANTFFANDDPANHGTQGAVLTTGYTAFSSIVPPYVNSLQSLGVNVNKASHGGKTIGTWSVTATLDPVNRTRSYSTTAFYDPNSARSNLVLLTGAQATKIALKNQANGQKTATSVTFVANDNKTYTATARKEIIISAGTIKTPQLLELSGIGQAKLLQSLGIPVQINLPGVGEKLQDHPGVIATFQTLDNATTWDELQTPALAAQQFQEYESDREGLYSAAPSTASYIPLVDFLDQPSIVALKASLDKALKADPKFNTPEFAMQRRWLDDPTIPLMELILFPQSAGILPPNATSANRFYTISALLNHAWSRGSTHITSKNGLVAPSIDMNYLNSPANIDAQFFIAILRFCLKISQTQPMRSLTEAVLAPALNATDADLIEWTKEHLNTNYHLIGTAAMLPRNNDGVVDPEFLVYGTSNLRVVDASIFPMHIATHPVATLYGIAERAARVIRQAN